MNSINDFPWNRPALVTECYKGANYRIVNTGLKTVKGQSPNALIFFSSNGIYFPNNETEFTNKMIKRDYYDWLNIGKHRMIRRHFHKIIYVRDIYKQWYVTGINEKLDCVDKLYDFLNEETKGFTVTTCGSSSGGYMSALMGSLLKADRIIAASAQFSLFLGDNPGPFVEEIRDDPSRNGYMEIKDLVRSNSGNLYYFYPARSEKDLMQNETVKDVPLKRFAIDSDKHNRTLLPVCYPYVLTMEKDKLDRLCTDHAEVITDPNLLHREMVSPVNRLIDPLIYNISRVKGYIFK